MNDRDPDHHHPDPPTPRRLVTTTELAEAWGVSPRTIRRLVAARRLPCVRIGRLLRFDVADVSRFVTARRE